MSSGIRINPEPISELVERCFAKDQIHVVSTPELKRPYTRAGQKTQSPLPVIVRDSQRSARSWRILVATTKEIPTDTVLQLPLLVMIRDAALTGLGAAKLPNILVADDLKAGRLVSWGAATYASVREMRLKPRLSAHPPSCASSSRSIWASTCAAAFLSNAIFPVLLCCLLPQITKTVVPD